MTNQSPSTRPVNLLHDFQNVGGHVFHRGRDRCVETFIDKDSGRYFVMSLVEEGVTDRYDIEDVREVRYDDVIPEVNLPPRVSLEGDYLFGRSVDELGGDDDGVSLGDVGNFGDFRDQDFSPETLNKTRTIDEFEGL